VRWEELAKVGVLGHAKCALLKLAVLTALAAMPLFVPSIGFGVEG
jgi:hypothetical protein